MEELRQLARSPEIAGWIADPPRRLAPNIVQGVNLAIDPFWLRSYRAYFGFRTEQSPSADSFRTRKTTEEFRVRFDWRPPGWKEHCVAKGYTEDAPVVIQVLLRQRPNRDFLAEAPTNRAGHPIVYEYRSACEAFAAPSLLPGANVGGAGALPGTLGGFLRDSASGATLAVSCAHVFGPEGTEVYQPAPTKATGSVIGQVILSTLPDRSTPTTKCNRVMQHPVLDLAIAEISAGANVTPAFGELGKVVHLTRVADMTSDDGVVFLGARSKRPVLAKIGALNVWREVQIAGQSHCMGDMFILESRRYTYIRQDLAKNGDSGAWVISNDNDLVAWDGMVVAGDGASVYCSFAEQIVDTCREMLPSLMLEP